MELTRRLPTAPKADPALDGAQQVAAEWGRRTQAAYVSAAIADEVTLLLVQTGAPPD